MIDYWDISMLPYWDIPMSAANVIFNALDRLAYQFEDSTKFKEFLTAFLKEYQELEASEIKLLYRRYLDTAEGAQLDGIGEIVGVERPSVQIPPTDVFGFLDDPTSLGFGDYNNPAIGGNFWDGIYETEPIDDDLYRELIRAKIIENQTAMTVNDTLRLISYTFDEVLVRYILQVNLYPAYEIYKSLTPFEEILVANFPILIGLDFVRYITVPEIERFSFSGDPDTEGLGFGDYNDPSIGGNFAKIIV